MARYYFHLWTGDNYEMDAAGLELETADAAYLEAYRAAQDLCVELIRERCSPTSYRFEVADQSGRKIFDLPFSEIIGASSTQRPGLRRELMSNLASVQKVTLALKQEIERSQVTMAESRAVLARSRNAK